MSFTNPDQGEEQKTDQLTFKVGDREYDVNAAATKIENADNHISKLESENAEFRERMASLEAKLEQSMKIEEALETMKANKEGSIAENVQPEQNTTGLSEEQIAAITQSKMEEYLAAQQMKQQQEQAQSLAEQTYRETAEKLVGIYGDKVDEAVANKAKEMGVPASELFNMAKSPASAKLLLDAMTPKGGSTERTPSAGYNTSSLYGGEQEKSFLNQVEGKQLTSSTILDLLNTNGANY